jgi:triacylglycerol lipase
VVPCLLIFANLQNIIIPIFDAMKKYYYLGFLLCLLACNITKQKALTITAKEVVGLNQLVYKDSAEKVFPQFAKDYELVYQPQAINGNYAVIVKNKSSNKYVVVIRGSVIEFSKTGFQNFILQDFNIFTMQNWVHTDTIKKASVSNGGFKAFENVLQLKDIKTQQTIKAFIEEKVPANALVTITGHSLGGNLANLLASYLKKQLSNRNEIDMQLITFAAPASGNAAFVQNLEEQFPKGERYEMDLDIACAFPDLDKVGDKASKLGLDSTAQLEKMILNYAFNEVKSNTWMKIASVVLEKTNILNEKNKYVQSNRHYRPLTATSFNESSTFVIDAMFKKAYSCHSINQYANVLDGNLLNKN